MEVYSPLPGPGLRLGPRSLQRQLSNDTPAAPSSPCLVRVPASSDDLARDEDADEVSSLGSASEPVGVLRTAEVMLPESPLVAKILLTDIVTLKFYNTDTADKFQREWELEEIKALDQTFDSQFSFYTFLQESLSVARLSEVHCPRPGSITCCISLSPDARKVCLSSLVHPSFSFIRPLRVSMKVWRIQEGTDTQRQNILMRHQSAAFKQLNRDNVEACNQVLIDMGCKLEACLRRDVRQSVQQMRSGLHTQVADLKLSLGGRVVLGDDNFIVSDRQHVTSLSSCRPGQARRLSTVDHVHYAVNSQIHADQISLFPSLTSLNLRGCDCITNLEFLRPLAQLKDLNLAGCKMINSLQPVSELRRLESINLTDCRGVEDAYPLYSLPVLRAAIVTGTKLDPQEVALSLRTAAGSAQSQQGVEGHGHSFSRPLSAKTRRYSDTADEDRASGNVEDMPPVGTNMNPWIGWRPLETVTQQLFGQKN